MLHDPKEKESVLAEENNDLRENVIKEYSKLQEKINEIYYQLRKMDEIQL